MIAPHELKNKTFSRAVRGYNPVEVDVYFDFLIEKYTEAYKLVLELEQKYNKINAKYAELSNEEESIRSAIVKAQKLGEVIVKNAENDAKDKEAEMEEKCRQIVIDAKNKVEAEKENFAKLRKMALDFQHKLYDDYVKHVEMIQAMNLDQMPDESTMLSEDNALQSVGEEVLGKPLSLPENEANQEKQNEDV